MWSQVDWHRASDTLCNVSEAACGQGENLMPLQPFRRHSAPVEDKPDSGCAHFAEGRTWKRCNCPLWIDGTLTSGKRVLESAKTRVWSKALELCREMETQGRKPKVSLSITLTEAIEAFLEYKVAQKITAGSLENYKCLLVGKDRTYKKPITASLRKFAEERGIRDIQQFNGMFVEQFRNQWTVNTAKAAKKKLMLLREFCSYCVGREWMASNHAKRLKPPKDESSGTMPYTSEQMLQILAACDNHSLESQEEALKMKALVLVLRYTGLRIGDAVMLRVDQVGPTGKLYLYTAKSKTAVNCILPPQVVDLLDACRASTTHFFWDGQMKRLSLTHAMRRSLLYITRDTGIPKIHPHRMRDTFAIELLNAGVPIERVSMALGHKNIAITQQCYLPWIEARQRQLEEDQVRSWESDPLLSPKAKADVSELDRMMRLK